MRRYAVLATMILAGMAARGAHAEPIGTHVYVTPTIGMWRWDENAATLVTIPDQGSLVFGGRLGYAPTDVFALEGVVLTGTNDGTLMLPAGDEIRSLCLTQTELSLVVNFQSLLSGRVYPFLTLGMGASFRSGGETIDGDASFDDTRLNFHIGGGIKVDLTSRMVLRFNVRDTFFVDNQQGNQNRQVTVDSVELSMGLEYRVPLTTGGGSRRLR